MTVKIPSRNLGDRILGILGKKRAVFILGNLNEEYGPYVYAQAKREGFLKALFRGKDTALPEGWGFMDDLRGQKQE